MRLLIVDDSRVIRKAILHFTADCHFELAEEAADGLAALEIFKASSPDLVTMDITMPGMDGLSCLEEMMKLQPDCRIIVISAMNDPGTALKARKLGAVGFLGKPFTGEELRTEIEKAGV